MIDGFKMFRFRPSETLPVFRAHLQLVRQQHGSRQTGAENGDDELCNILGTSFMKENSTLELQEALLLIYDTLVGNVSRISGACRLDKDVS